MSLRSDSTESVSVTSAVKEQMVEGPSSFLTGWRLYLVTASLSLSMFIVNIEVSIVATALISIVNDLHGFNQSGWVLTAYLVTYCAMMILWSKFSNVFGRKSSLLASTIIFTVFSGGCGAAQTMIQLIVCRALQGVGAAGCLSIALTMVYEMVPQEKWPKWAAMMSSVSALGSLIGPILGGVFSEDISWRWSFLINVPMGAAIAILMYISIPNYFPYHNHPEGSPGRQLFVSIKAIKTLDLIGAFLLLGASLLLVTALLEADVSFAWDSAASICLFVFAGVFIAAFLYYEFYLSRSKTKTCDPVFPWEFLTNRYWMGVLLLSLFSGAPYIVTMIDIPQRLQTIEGLSALDTGLRLIPFNLLVAFGSAIVNVIAARTKIAPIYLFAFGVVLEITGVSLFSTMRDIHHVPHAIYGYQIITGLGIGFLFGLCVVLPPVVTDNRDYALCAGAVFQFRIFGSALALAISTAVVNNYAKSGLLEHFSPQAVEDLLKSTEAIAHMTYELKDDVLEVLVEAWSRRMKVLIGFTAVQVVPLAMLWRNPQIAIAEKAAGTAAPNVAKAQKRDEEKALPWINTGNLSSYAN